MSRSNAEAEPQLPVYSVKKSTQFRGWLIVTCPREDCSDFFLVRGARWLKKLERASRVGKEPVITITGRSCPYCMRVSRIPKKIN